MRRAALLVAAAAIVLIADGFLLLGAARNKAGEPSTSIELTERELRLQSWGEGRTWGALRLDFNNDLYRRQTSPGWFDRAKLAALGFDCRVAADDPEARGFYGWKPAREMWVVLELDGEAAKRWLEERRQAFDATMLKLGAEQAASEEAKRAGEAYQREIASRSRLFAVDAGTDAGALRGRYPDRARYIVAPAIVSADWYRRWDPNTRTLGTPFIRGHIERLLVEEIQVPRAKRALLDSLTQSDAGKASRKAAESAGPDSDLGFSPDGKPRYRVLLRYGSHHDPWVEEVSPISD